MLNLQEQEGTVYTLPICGDFSAHHSNPASLLAYFKCGSVRWDLQLFISFSDVSSVGDFEATINKLMGIFMNTWPRR